MRRGCLSGGGQRYNPAMALVRDLCLCVGKVEYSETSQVLTLFSREHGVVKVLAKGAHRRTRAGAGRFDGGVDLLDLGEAVFTEDPKAELALLTEWKLQEGNLDLRRTLRGLYLALYAAELVSVLIESRDPHVELFDRMARTLPELATDRAEEAMLAWELDLLKYSGYLPELFKCVACGAAPEKGQAVFFSPSRGGLICRNCQASAAERIPLDGRLLRLAQSILLLPRVGGVALRLPRLTRTQSDPLNRLLAEHITYTLGKRLKSWKYLAAQPARR
jgi:DNA repair protein RecO (recombination protein O)